MHSLYVVKGTRTEGWESIVRNFYYHGQKGSSMDLYLGCNFCCAMRGLTKACVL